MAKPPIRRERLVTRPAFVRANRSGEHPLLPEAIEAYFKLNTLDLQNDRPNRDGIVRGWFDGKLVVEHTDVVLRSTDFPNMKFNQFLMAPYFGPGLLPHAQKLWIDELTVGTGRIGPLAVEATPQ